MELAPLTVIDHAGSYEAMTSGTLFRADEADEKGCYRMPTPSLDSLHALLAQAATL